MSSLEEENDICLYGYEIFEDVHYYIDSMLLVNHKKDNFARIQLRTTMGNLLKYFLDNACKEFISDEELMSNVWERNNLRASSHRLWQVVKDLNYRLKEAGITDDVFKRVNRQRRFSVNKEGVVALYKANVS